MMASQEERDNYFSLTLLLFRVGSQKLREYFKTQWPIVYQRFKPGTVPPPWNDTPHDAAEMKKIQPSKLQFKFKDEETKFNLGNTNDWDFSLLTSVLRYSSLQFVLPSSPKSRALDDLKKIRNKLIGHATDAAIPDALFHTAWTGACNALALFNASAADFKSVKDDVKKPLDVLYPMLQQGVKQEKEIRDSVDKMINKIEQLQQTVEKQHTSLQQTVKQQHTSLQQTVKQQHETQLEETRNIARKVAVLVAVVAVGFLYGCKHYGPRDLVIIAVIGALLIYLTYRAYMMWYIHYCSRALKSSIEKRTESLPKNISSHDVTSAKTDDIFTNLTVYYANKKQEKKEQEKDLNRSQKQQGCTKRTTGFKVEKYEDIFIGMKEGNRKFLLSGKPGIGKTMFCEKVIRDWSMNRLFQNENTPNIKFAYLLKFRQLSLQGDKEMNLQELLNCSPILDDNSKINDSLFEYLITNSSEVLIILDGFDEFSETYREQIAGDFEKKYPNDSTKKMPIPELCSKLIKGIFLKNSVVLVSSRPEEAEVLGEINFDRYVEISGFSPEQVIEYVDKYFSEPEKQQTKMLVSNHVRKNENLISFCHIPLLSFLLCWSLDWQITREGITENLPAKITDLYRKVIKVLIEKLHARLKDQKMPKHEKEKIVQETLDKLAKLAAYLLKKSKYIFDEEDMNELNLTEDEIENLKKSGILHCVPGIRISEFETKAEFSFTHLTLQEYLSASSFVKDKEIPEDVSGQTIVFMFGILSRENNEELLNALIERKTQDDNVNRLLILQCLYEYGNEELSKQTINNLYDKYCGSNGIIRFYGVTTEVDIKYISYLLDIIRSLKEQDPQSSSDYTLFIRGSPLTSFGVGVVCSSLVPNSFITELKLPACRLNDKCVEKMTESLVKTGITHLDLRDNEITGEGVKSISSVLADTKITHLDLGWNKITDQEAERICEVIIQDDCQVEQLDLWGNEEITVECKKRVKHFVKEHKPGVNLVIEDE